MDIELPLTAAARRKAERGAAVLIAANDNKTPKARVRYRGTRPAWNWLKKHDEREAAALWLIARRMLPEAANDNCREPGLKHIDRRDDGRPRGPQEPVFNASCYLAIPAARSSPLHAESYQRAIAPRGWHNAAGFAIKPQRKPGEYPSSPLCRFTRCLPGAAWQYGSLIETVRKSSPGARRGDIRRVDEPDLPEMPDDIFVTIEAMLSGATLADVGAMHGARGGYRDVKGKVMMLRAGAWALSATGLPETRQAA